MAYNIGPFKKIVGVSWASGWEETLFSGWLNPSSAYTISPDGRTIDVQFEDGIGCGGSNGNVQVVELKRTIYGGASGVRIDAAITGNVGHLSSLYEMLLIAIENDANIAKAVGQDTGVHCSMGPPVIEFNNSYNVPAGQSVVLAVVATTRFNYGYFSGAYFNVAFTFTPLG